MKTNPKQNKLSFIGMGFVGKAMYHAFCSHFDVKIYDKYQEGYDTLEKTVRHSNVIFICVPTPMRDDGSQDLRNVYDVCDSVSEVVKENHLPQKILVIKTTVIPGTCRNLNNQYSPQLEIVMNPEFLTERVAVKDFLNQTRIVLGGMAHGKHKLKQVYEIRFPETEIFSCSWEEAELTKYVANCFFALKISYMNEIYEICREIGCDFETVKQAFLADGRVAQSHCEVPFQGDFGFGGKCFPKDTHALVMFGLSLGLKMDTLNAALNTNDRVRKNQDWKHIVGATSDNDYGRKDS